MGKCLNSPSSSRNATLVLCALTLAAVFVALSFRSTQTVGIDLFHPGLWGEDGSIFVNEARDAGLGFLFKPYAGYMHLIPRAISYPASFLPLEYVPLAFHLAWIAAFLTTIYILQSRLSSIGVPAALCVWALVLVTLQPQAGEVFFTLTNIQWFTGLALITYLAFPITSRVSIGQLALLTIAGLTGPFSVLALPVLALRAVLFRDLLTNRRVYVTVAICAAIQIGFIVFSPRPIASNPSSFDPAHLLAAMVKFVSFGGVYPLATLFAFVFWASLPWRRIFNATVSHVRNRSALDTHAVAQLTALILILTAFGLILVGFLRDDPATMGPVILPTGAAGGSRYYLIPYSLLILAAAVSNHRDYPRAIVALAAFSIICAANLVRPDRIDHQWHAYAQLARVMPGSTIPIAPRTESIPGWSVDASQAYQQGAKPKGEALIPLTAMEVSNGEVASTDGKLVIRSTSDSLLLTLSARPCPSSTSIALEVKGRREAGGWIQVLWAAGEGFSDRDGVLRFYPAGDFTGMFAFDRTLDQDKVRIRPVFAPGKAEIHQVRMICL
ncbi:hypothetical protein SMSKK35_1486 [Stenotrophomonas maltophilia SKK35]|nr:hypothetical protein SMSKK35_1486 [Stenotrophomonas maltophilia SKK35]